MFVKSDRESDLYVFFFPFHAADNLPGVVQRASSAELLPGRGELPGYPPPPGRHHVPPGAALWRADAEAVEPQELQGPRVSTRDAAGCGAVQQEDLPDHQARSVSQ